MSNHSTQIKKQSTAVIFPPLPSVPHCYAGVKTLSLLWITPILIPMIVTVFPAESQFLPSVSQQRPPDGQTIKPDSQVVVTNRDISGPTQLSTRTRIRLDQESDFI